MQGPDFAWILIAGGFGVDRSETSATALADLDEPGRVSARWSVPGGAGADTTPLLATEAAIRDGVLWTALTGRTGEVFTDAAEAVVLDQLFGSAGLDLVELLGEGES